MPNDHSATGGSLTGFVEKKGRGRVTKSHGVLNPRTLRSVRCRPPKTIEMFEDAYTADITLTDPTHETITVFKFESGGTSDVSKRSTKF